MSVKAGEDLVLQVNTGTVSVPVWTPIANMNAYSKSKTRPRNRYRAFGGVTHVLTQTAEEDFSLSGYLDPEDPGQQKLRDVEATETDVQIRVFPVGTTNGTLHTVRVNSYTHDADPEGLQEHGFELTSVAPATVVGAGPIL